MPSAKMFLPDCTCGGCETVRLKGVEWEKKGWRI